MAVTVLSSFALGILTTVDCPVKVDWVSFFVLAVTDVLGGGPAPPLCPHQNCIIDIRAYVNQHCRPHLAEHLVQQMVCLHWIQAALMSHCASTCPMACSAVGQAALPGGGGIIMP